MLPWAVLVFKVCVRDNQRDKRSELRDSTSDREARAMKMPDGE